MGKKDSFDLIKEIKQFLAKVKADEGILFGSRVKEGEALENSDVDLVVVSDRFEKMPFPRRLVFLHDNWSLPFFLEGLPYTPGELKRLSKSRGVVAEALKNGIRIKAA